MRRFSLLPALLLSTALVFSLAACDSNDDDDNGGPGGGGNLGSYSATLGGDLSGSISGNAFFSVVDDEDVPGGRAFVLVLFDGPVSEAGTSGRLLGFVRMGDRPGTGQYPIAAEDPETSNAVIASYLDFRNEAAGVFFSGESGTFTVTTSSSNRVAGSFTFTGSGFDMSNPQDSQEINGSISGTFDAVYVNPDTVPTGGF